MRLRVTFAILVFSEILPKVVAASHAERVALPSSYVLAIVIKLFYPVVSIATGLVRGMLWLLRIDIQADHSHHKLTLEELRSLVLESGNFLPRKHQKMLLNLVDLERITVNDVMVPRNQIEALNVDADPIELRQQIITCHHTLLPVYAETPSNVIGILHVKDVLRVMNQPDCQDVTARNLARETLYIPETLRVNELLHQFRHNRQHIAIVLDEYGGTAGLVTLEDLLEEIVGEVSDQFDETLPEIQTQPDGSAIIDGLTLIEAVNQQLNLNLSDPHYDTIAGYFLGKLGHIPKLGEAIESGGVRLQVKSMDGLRIAQLNLVRLNTTPPE